MSTTQETQNNTNVQILPDFEGLKEFYFAKRNEAQSIFEEPEITWKEGSFSFANTTKAPQYCSNCHNIKYPATASVLKKNRKGQDEWRVETIPHKQFCKVQHQCKSLARCNSPKTAGGHAEERLRAKEEGKKRKRSDSDDKIGDKKKQRKAQEEESRRKSIESSAKSAVKAANKFKSPTLSSFVNTIGVAKITHGSAKVLNDGLKVANYVSQLDSEDRVVFNYANMNEAEKNAAQLGCAIMGKDNPQWTTYEPGIEDYEGALAQKKKILLQLRLHALNVVMEIAYLERKRVDLVMRRAKDVAKNGSTWRRHSDGASVMSLKEKPDLVVTNPKNFTNSKTILIPNDVPPRNNNNGNN